MHVQAFSSRGWLRTTGPAIADVVGKSKPDSYLTWSDKLNWLLMVTPRLETDSEHLPQAPNLA